MDKQDFFYIDQIFFSFFPHPPFVFIFLFVCWFVSQFGSVILKLNVFSPPRGKPLKMAGAFKPIPIRTLCTKCFLMRKNGRIERYFDFFLRSKNEVVVCQYSFIFIWRSVYQYGPDIHPLLLLINTSVTQNEAREVTITGQKQKKEPYHFYFHIFTETYKDLLQCKPERVMNI